MTSDYSELLSILPAHSVNYLVIGVYAKLWHEMIGLEYEVVHVSHHR